MEQELINLAKKMSNSNNCCHDSNYSVGAVLVSQDNRIFTGMNIENDGIMSICAERVAFAKALSEGVDSFKSIYIAGAYKGTNIFDKCLPCGYCRQFMMQYGGPNLEIYTVENNQVINKKLSDLLPDSFRFYK